MLQMCQLLKHETKIKKFIYHDVDVVPITVIATPVCKFFVVKLVVLLAVSTLSCLQLLGTT